MDRNATKKKKMKCRIRGSSMNYDTDVLVPFLCIQNFHKRRILGGSEIH